MEKGKTMCRLALVLWLVFAIKVSAQQAEKPYLYIPETVSEEWRTLLASLSNPDLLPAVPSPTDIESWEILQKDVEASRRALSDTAVKKFQSNVTPRIFGGVPVLDVTPKNWKDNGKILVYTHGGGYTLHSARTTLYSSAFASDKTGLRVISVDYALAPQAKWRHITDQVINVFEELNKQGYSTKDMAVLGDSAGGGLAAGVVLKMRDSGMDLPAAVILWSPWADITETGDTYATLRRAEPMYTYEKILKPSANAYADPEDQKNPYVSPVYGDYSKGFPPTLIQGGTKEILLSNFIRLYQAMDSAGQTVKLDLYEGMIHVFQPRLPGSTESKTALRKVNAFLNQHLGK